MKPLSLFSSKRGLGIGQVFIFIVAALTFALIMIFGYRAIGDFVSSGEDVVFVQFKNDLETSVKQIYTEFGSVRLEEFTAPSRYERVCIVDLDAPISDDERAELARLNPYALSVWEAAQDRSGSSFGYSSQDENVFLLPQAPVKIKVFDLTIEGNSRGFLCEDVHDGKFSLLLEGRGSHTDIRYVRGEVEES